MKKKTWLLFLVLILCFSFFSCKENTKVAVLAFDAGPGVSDDTASLARKTVVDYAIKRKKIDVLSTELNAEQNADIIITGTIALSTRELNLVDSIKGNTAWYDVEVNSINVKNGTIIKSFSGTYDAKMDKMKNHVKKLKLGGGGGLRWWWWVVIGIVIICGIAALAGEMSGDAERFLYGSEGQKQRRRKKAIKDITDMFN